VLLNGELIVETLQRFGPDDEGRPGVVEAREEIAYTREI
jgi:hypothetical protein